MSKIQSDLTQCPNGMLMKTKYRKQLSKLFLNKFQRIAQRKQHLKFERNPFIKYRHIGDTGGRRTNFDFMRSADIVKES